MISIVKGSYHEPRPFAVDKDERNIKKDTGKSIKNALCALRYAKGHLSSWSNVK